MENNNGVKAISIAFLNQHYYPDVAATAQNLTDLCEHLAAQGYDVHVYCSRGHYLSGKMKAPRYEYHNGVHIHRLGATSFGRTSNLGRMIDYLSFFLLSFIRLVTGKRFDMICTLTTPPMLGLVGTLATLPKATRHIIWSMDLHPDAEIALGMMKEKSITARLLNKLNRYSYRQASMVISLGPYMTQRLTDEYGVDAGKVSEIPIWSDKNEIAVMNNGISRVDVPDHLDDRFIINYNGNMGLVHSFDEICQVMKAYKNHPDVGFTFTGDGPRKQELISFVEQEEIENVAFMPYVDRHGLSRSLAKADVHWFSLRPEFAGMAVPGKCYGYMASGRPIIFIGPEESDNAGDIRAGECGFVCEPGQVDDIIDSVERLLREPVLREIQGLNARSYFEQNADREVSCRLWDTSLMKLQHGEAIRDVEYYPITSTT